MQGNRLIQNTTNQKYQLRIYGHEINTKMIVKRHWIINLLSQLTYILCYLKLKTVLQVIQVPSSQKLGNKLPHALLSIDLGIKTNCQIIVQIIDVLILFHFFVVSFFNFYLKITNILIVIYSKCFGISSKDQRKQGRRRDLNVLKVAP